MNRHLPRLVEIDGGWLLAGFILPGHANTIFPDYVSARAHLLAARRWRRELLSLKVADEVAELAQAELTGIELALEREAL